MACPRNVILPVPALTLSFAPGSIPVLVNAQRLPRHVDTERIAYPPAFHFHRFHALHRRLSRWLESGYGPAAGLVGFHQPFVQAKGGFEPKCPADLNPGLSQPGQGIHPLEKLFRLRSFPFPI